MADLKTTKEINKELERQQGLLKNLDESSKIYANTQKEILRLQRELTKARQKENAELASQQPLYKQIESSIQTRLKKAKELSTQGSKASKLHKEGQQIQAKLLVGIQSQVNHKGELNKISQEQLDVVEAIGMGTNDIAGLQNQLAQSEKRKLDISKEYSPLMHEDEENLQKILNSEIKRLQAMDAEKAKLGFIDKLTAGLASKAKEFKEVWQENPKVAGYIALGGIMGLLATMAKKFAGMVDAIGQQFGSLNMMGKDFQTNLHDSTVEATKLGLSQADVLNTTSALASEYGISLDKAAELSVKILDTAKATGLSVDESTKLYGTLMQVVDLSKEEAENLIESTAQLARQRGVAPQAVLKDIANSSEVIATFTKGAGENLFEAAIAARELGLNVDTIAKSARGMLDLESSLNAEYEASALLGKQINLQKARELAYSKDLKGFSKELKNQLRGVGDFTKLNIFQQEAIAKAIGMSVGETSKLLSKTKEQEDATKKLTLAGALAAGSFDDLHGQKALSNLSKVVNKFKAFIQQALITVGPILEGIIGKFHDWFMTMDGINKVQEGMKTLRTWIGEISVKVTEFFDQGKGWDEMKEKLFGVDGALHGVSVAFEAIGGAIKLIARNIPEVIGLMISLKAASFAAFLVQSALAAAGGAAAHPWLLGGGAVIAAAAILGVVNSINAMTPPPTPTADFKSGPGGISYMSGPAGAFSLNPRDSVLATTNPIPVNDFQTGGLMPDFTVLVEAQRETTRAISSMRLSTTVTNRQQETIMEGTFNPLGGRSLLGGGGSWA